MSFFDSLHKRVQVIFEINFQIDFSVPFRFTIQTGINSCIIHIDTVLRTDVSRKVIDENKEQTVSKSKESVNT